MLTIFQYDFMVRALAAGLTIATIAPLIGMFLVTRRYSFMADTLAHVSFAGVAVGYLLGLNPLLTASIVSVLTSLVVDDLRSAKKLSGDAVLSLFLSGSLAVAAVLLSLTRSRSISVSTVLFGSITTVSPLDLLTIALIGIAVVLTVAMLYRHLFLFSYDEELALSSGLAVGFHRRIFIVLAALTVSLSLHIVGILLMSALMVIPVLTAMQWKQGFLHTMFIAVAVSLFSALIGLVTSFYVAIASGGAIVLVSICCFFVSSIVARR